MDCEMCGKPIEGKPIRVKIDGAAMDVCKDCSKFGKIQKVPRPSQYMQKKDKNKKRTNKPARNYSKNDEPAEELVENYGSIIRNARESKKLSREQLGEKIFEKVSVISKIETEKMDPDLKLARKLEKTLNIKLIEKSEKIDLESYQNISRGGNTIGSVVKIKKSKK
ncbi:multiprotein bridging factor aMBF1 [uncultured Methanobrevibacter sp.]|uniref:multiprotein bridging factor aMBF1 n=1 Tax=uncultured Methanobrevibacter sp. TaxID=253161 RepID=UPI0025D02820|nr:multiprotein bridging factor aMBF1 [uncultured Methanobrevibacter sp.]